MDIRARSLYFGALRVCPSRTTEEGPIRTKTGRVMVDSKADDIISAFPLPILVTRLSDGLILFANGRVEDILGVAPEDLLGTSTTRYYDASVRAEVLEEIAREGRVDAKEVGLERPDGARRVVLASFVPILFDDEDALLSTVVDVTDRKRAENQLARMSQVFAHARFPIFVHDLEGRIEDVNRQVVDTFGLPREELIGRTYHGLVDPEFHSGADAMFAACRRGEKVPDAQGVARDASGRQWPVLVSMSAVRDGSGEPAAVATVLKDISDLRWKQTFDHAAIGLATCDPEATAIESSNPEMCRMYGFADDGMTGRTIDDVFGLAGATEFRQHARRVMAERAGHDYETLHPRRDGTEFPVQVGLATGRGSRRDRPFIVINAQDITQRRELEDQLYLSQKLEAVGRLAGGIAHDFNNLLAVMMTCASMSLDHLPRDHEVRADIRQILDAAERAKELTSSLLAFSRRRMIEPRIVDLNDMVVGTEKILARILGEDIELTTSLAEYLWTTRIDPGQLEQIIVNLAVNARDAMATGGKLLIETRNSTLDVAYVHRHPVVAAGDYATLVVSDDGQGMDEETRAHAFEPFFTTKGRGSGLGLATCYGIVKQARGYIWLYSEPGRGTTVKIYLPRTDGPTEQPSRPSEPPAHLDGSETVLVAEDEEALRRIVVRVLGARGYRVIEAVDGEDAVEQARRHDGDIHLLLSDVVMPRMSGPEAARTIEQERPRTRILFMSGYTDDALGHHGIVEPGTSVLEKPFTPRQLLGRIREILDQEG